MLSIAFCSCNRLDGFRLLPCLPGLRRGSPSQPKPHELYFVARYAKSTQWEGAKFRRSLHRGSRLEWWLQAPAATGTELCEVHLFRFFLHRVNLNNHSPILDELKHPTSDEWEWHDGSHEQRISNISGFYICLGWCACKREMQIHSDTCIR